MRIYSWLRLWFQPARLLTLDPSHELVALRRASLTFGGLHSETDLTSVYVSQIVSSWVFCWIKVASIESVRHFSVDHPILLLDQLGHNL